MWKSREVSVRQVNVLIRAVTCLASLVEKLPQAFKHGFTSDINYGGLVCLCVSYSKCGTEAAINVTGLNPHSTFLSTLPLMPKTEFNNSHCVGLCDQYL